MANTNYKKVRQFSVNKLIYDEQKKYKESLYTPLVFV